jgi:hypothetical protein
MKRSVFKLKEGNVVKIKLDNNSVFIGRVIPGIALILEVYSNEYTEERLLSIDLQDVSTNKILFYAAIYRNELLNGKYPIIGNIPFEQNEIDRIPPFFIQDKSDFRDCTIFWNNGQERKATPNECIGLEASAVWTLKSLVQRIEDWKNGRKNIQNESLKVILNETDPRNTDNPTLLRWDFNKEEFYLLEG